MNSIKLNELEEILGFQIDEDLQKQIENLHFENITSKERDDLILKNVLFLLNDKVVVSGDHRINDWDNGWRENLETFKLTKKLDDLIPKYHGKYKYLRWRGDFIKSVSDNLDYKLHIILVDSILRHYLKNLNNVYEFGCGPAYHLLRFSRYNKDCNLFGGDWAKSSQEIISEINKVLSKNINAFNFDFYNPNYEIDIKENSGIYTVAALEQVGRNYEKFVQFLIDKKPEICVHMEPISELLDDDSLLDKLSIEYFKKRNYLTKFLPYLENLEKQGLIEIIKKQRIHYGSLFIEGHSLVVWRPKK